MGKNKIYSDETSKLCQKLWEAADSPGGRNAAAKR